LTRVIDDAAERHYGFTYDALGRLVEREDHVAGETSTTQWQYDTAAHGIGKIAKVTSPAGHVDVYTYTSLSQPATHTLTLGDTGDTFESGQSYDALGRVSLVFYPPPVSTDEMIVRREYDAFGNLVTVRDDTTQATYWQLGQLDGAGRATVETLGNGVRVDRGYVPDSGLVQRIHAERGSTETRRTVLQDLVYSYDLGLRMTTRSDDLQAGAIGARTERFDYDAIDRLTCASIDPPFLGKVPVPCAAPIDYESNGNIKRKDGLAYAYDPAHPHAVKAVGGDAFESDGVGNQTVRPGATIAYAPFDLPASYTLQDESVTDFDYDGSQHRIRKTRVAGLGTPIQETVYLDERYERVRAGGVDQHRFYVGAGTATLVLTRATGAADQAEYLLTDALGSVDTVTSGEGTLIEKRSYDAFGARRNPAWGAALPAGGFAPAVPPMGFTGQEGDDEAGLVNMRGRIYDPKIGRFLSTDPLVSRPGFTQSWNPYSYVLNSPLDFTDPSGFEGTATGADNVTYAT
jgi:RHS repeat-associated protein